MSVKRPLKVMEAIYCFDVGGSERLGADIARELVASGFSAHVCATHTGPGLLSRQLRAEGIGCSWLRSPERSPLSVLSDLYRLFRRERVDVLHAHHVPMFRLCYWPARLAGVRHFVLTEHTDYEMKNDARLLRMGRAYAGRADLVTTVHDGLREYFVRELDAPAERVVTIENGVDHELFSPGSAEPALARELGLPAGKVLLGFIGRLHPDKDLTNLVDALAGLAARVRDRLHVVVVGDGPERAAVAAAVRQRGLERSVTLAGERSDAARLLRLFDIFVMPSRTEGVPLTILEAMSSGLPCVATAVGGIPAVLSPTCGRVVPPRQSAPLGEAIAALVENPDLRRTLGRAARERVLQRFSRREMMRRYIEALMVRPIGPPAVQSGTAMGRSLP